MRGFFTIAAAIAERQEGRVSLEQLLAAGIDGRRVERWLRDGRLRRVHTGVYAVGHVAASVDADYMAAVLVGGEGAALSHRAAAYKLGLLRGPAPPLPRSPSGRWRTAAGRASSSTASACCIRSTSRASARSRSRSSRASSSISRLRRHPRSSHDSVTRRGSGTARSPSTSSDASPATRASRESASCGSRSARPSCSASSRAASWRSRSVALPLPRTNIDHRGDKVDCHWPQIGLTIELVSFRYHATRRAFERDVARRRRSNHVAYTYGDVFERGEATIADLRPRLESD